MSSLTLKLRGPNGVKVLKDLDKESCTLADLRKASADACFLSEMGIELLVGFPPKPISSASSSLINTFLRSGETIIVRGSSQDSNEAKQLTATSKISTSSTTSTSISSSTSAEWSCAACTYVNSSSRTVCEICQTSQPSTAAEGSSFTSSSAKGCGSWKAAVRKVADDNSCLFHSIIHLLDPSSTPDRLRQRVASEVKRNPHQWNAATLGRAPDEYIQFITNPIRWGGQIELAILSDAYKAEIGVSDIATGRMDIFGEGKYNKRVFVCYSGLHFDPIELSNNDSKRVKQLTGPDRAQATNAVSELIKSMKDQGQFTDRNTMRLRCKICGHIVNGDYEARVHAGMGHTEFAPA